jgi:hypothetical protein
VVRKKIEWVTWRILIGFYDEVSHLSPYGTIRSPEWWKMHHRDDSGGAQQPDGIKQLKSLLHHRTTGIPIVVLTTHTLLPSYYPIYTLFYFNTL